MGVIFRICTMTAFTQAFFILQVVSGGSDQQPDSHSNMQALTDQINNLRKIVERYNLLVGSTVNKSKELACPTGYTTIGHLRACYQFVKTKLDWTDSVKQCANDGATLLTVDSEDEDEYIRLYLYTNKALRGVDFHTAGNDVGTEGVYKWYPSGRPMGVVQWGPNHPEGKKAEHCVCLWYDPTNKRYDWYDYLCEYKRGRICKISMGR